MIRTKASNMFKNIFLGQIMRFVLRVTWPFRFGLCLFTSLIFPFLWTSSDFWNPLVWRSDWGFLMLGGLISVIQLVFKCSPMSKYCELSCILWFMWIYEHDTRWQFTNFSSHAG
jgi:hypothetical protein